MSKSPLMHKHQGMARLTHKARARQIEAMRRSGVIPKEVLKASLLLQPSLDGIRR